jgi:hypothetical protein
MSAHTDGVEWREELLNYNCHSSFCRKYIKINVKKTILSLVMKERKIKPYFPDFESRMKCTVPVLSFCFCHVD